MSLAPPARPRLLAILGPTGAGKSAAAFSIARRLGGEIVVCDSRQVYRELDISTNKPPKDELEAVPHHLVDVADPRARFTVHDFQHLATEAVLDIARRGRLAILEGGSSLWAQALLDGYRLPGGTPPTERRRTLDGLPLPALQERLAELDPEARVDRQNPRRLVRAIEILEELGGPLERHRERHPPDWEICRVGLRVPLAVLDRRLRSRSADQVARGVVEETRQALERGVPPDAPVLSGIGYLQARAFLDGELQPLELLGAMARANSRYARRQLRWLGRDPRIEWIEATDDPSARILTYLSMTCPQFLRAAPAC
ncbi:MAG: tRNA (adenosine(37)-N6)-dimethylallyltransferase MiaA [Candidatus Dormibacteraceae bacterium]